MSDNPPDWSQFYQQISSQVLPPVRPGFGDRGGVADVNITATTTTLEWSFKPEGRVAKPIRRRSRASRRTPTTLLNTDTTNFRAMVQQFTGGPSAPFASGSQIHATNFGYAVGVHRQGHHVNHPSPVMVPPGYHLQYQQQQQQQQFQQQSQPPPPYMFSLRNNDTVTNTSTAATPGDVFFQRLGNPRAAASMEVSDHGYSADHGAFLPGGSAV
uniref:VQ domain-containing protein n=1 Tax=Salix viminalis TaxID=40686 RepID=A0A6N2LDA4_SALVM